MRDEYLLGKCLILLQALFNGHKSLQILQKSNMYKVSPFMPSLRSIDCHQNDVS